MERGAPSGPAPTFTRLSKKVSGAMAGIGKQAYRPLAGSVGLSSIDHRRVIRWCVHAFRTGGTESRCFGLNVNMGALDVFRM